ncbi:hypothetical protein NUU61_004791 [Penicillium alfredii]|uniref:Protein kinase domain-containing protein n=1 Tax=Penicillium alfredii TaxID=1506179 RepID=A0A9W9F874_9EURO|nr:uncharacterized protein NUU61_004791 [Penicillium alfredii]KAJ5095435.1 hypothetical protein NUU61_004791 [Penicillium alfredii]
MHLFYLRLVLWGVYSLLVLQVISIPVPEENLPLSQIDDGNEFVPRNSLDGAPSLVRRAENAPPKSHCYDLAEKVMQVPRPKYLFPPGKQNQGSVSLAEKLGAGGGGGQGSVWMGQLKYYDTPRNRALGLKINLPRRVAVKISQGGRGVDQSLLADEIGSRWILRNLEIFWDPGNKQSVQVMDRAGLDMLTALSENKRFNRDWAMWNFGGALLDAHSMGIVHRDVKPENMVIRFRRVYLIDWDFAVDLRKSNEYSAPGTRGYHLQVTFFLPRGSTRANLSGA